ncbi:conserved hypothetical protein [Trichinella spiralis]|uniref:hypothetical protein n=1 Tax=Trichinella spiralis TaxID=6334 RepID=UPI0001EFCAAA|nr:conserved hypothetical protein [Trichinella spiralis]
MYPHLVNLFCSMEGLSVLNKDSYKRVLWHRRMMAISTCMTCIGVVLLAICAMTTSWAVVEILQENNSTIQLHMGVWGEWKIVANATHQTINYYYTISRYYTAAKITLPNAQLSCCLLLNCEQMSTTQ